MEISTHRLAVPQSTELDSFQDPIHDSCNRTRNSLSVIFTTSLNYLSVEEEHGICDQFQGSSWRCNGQVLWSGIQRDLAQQWADAHGMQTLTTAMGSLMDPEHPKCLKNAKTTKNWSKYVKGASALFAWHISRGEMVTVLLPPPPERFHPSGLTNYQAIEEPIVKGENGGRAVLRIEIVHPTVHGAENFRYQVWPVDETCKWIEHFGILNMKRRWREIRINSENLSLSRMLKKLVRNNDGDGDLNRKKIPKDCITSIRTKAQVTPIYLTETRTYS
jgi:hypothetical protein